MRKNLTIKSLDAFGLTSYETKSYLSLLEKRQLTASEISRLAGIPRGRIYDTLEHLEAKGLCQKVSDKVKLYSAVDPSQLKEILINMEKDKTNSRIEKLRIEMLKEKERFEAEIQNEKAKLEEKIKGVEDLSDTLSPIYEESRDNNDDIDYIEIIKDRTQLRKRIITLYDSAQKELLSFCPSSAKVPREMIAEQLDKEKEYIKRGVLWTSIYEIPKEIEQIEWLKGYLDEVTALGEHARVIEEIPVQMAVIDEKCVVFQLEDPVSMRSASTFGIIQHTRLAISFKILFETLWQRAKDKEELTNIINIMKNNRIENGGV